MAITVDQIFREGFLPLYPEDARADLARARATDANPAGNPHIVEHLDEAARIFAKLAPAALGRDLELDRSDASVHRLGEALTREVRDRWLAEPAWGTAEGTLFNVVVHGSAYVGACILHGSREASWLVRRPLWESLVALRSPAGEAQLPIFHWWLKSLSDERFEGSGIGLGERYRTHVEVPTFDASALPQTFTTTRVLPRLAKVRYDTLYKYLRAHLPEIRDVGKDFPTAERLDDLRLRWMDVHVLGEGRLALFAGASDAGVHLFWLDANGFVKSAFVPADKFPDPKIEVTGDRIRVLARFDGKDVAHEMLWWGP